MKISPAFLKSNNILHLFSATVAQLVVAYCVPIVIFDPVSKRLKYGSLCPLSLRNELVTRHANIMWALD